MYWKIWWRVCLTGIFYAVVIPGSVFAQEQTFSLDDAVRYAMQNNGEVLIAQQNIARAEGQIQSAWSDALPRLSLNGFYARNWRVPTSVINGNLLRFGSTNVVNGNASLTIPLYRGGKSLAARRAAQAFRDLSTSNLEQTRQRVTFETQRSYYGVLLAERMLEVNEAAMSQAEALLDQVQLLFKVGKASEYEVLRARVQVANTRPSVIAARNNRDMAALHLNRVMGMNLDAPIGVVGSMETAIAGLIPVAVTLETAVDMAMKNRPEIEAMDYQLEMLEDGVRIQAGDKRPSVNLVNTYQNQAQVNDLNAISGSQFVQSYASRIVFDIPVFDGFKSRGGVAQAQADLNAARYTRKDRMKQIELEARQAFMRVEETRERMQAQQQAVGQAEKGLEIAQVRYRTGAATQLEIIDAQMVVTQIRTGYANALNDYAVALAGLQQAVGAAQ